MRARRITSWLVPAPRFVGRFASVYTGRPSISPTYPCAASAPGVAGGLFGPCFGGTTIGGLLVSDWASAHAHRRGCMMMQSGDRYLLVGMAETAAPRLEYMPP